MQPVPCCHLVQADGALLYFCLMAETTCLWLTDIVQLLLEMQPHCFIGSQIAMGHLLMPTFLSLERRLQWPVLFRRPHVLPQAPVRALDRLHVVHLCRQHAGQRPPRRTHPHPPQEQQPVALSNLCLVSLRMNWFCCT